MHGESHAAAHCYPVHVGYVGFGISGDQMIKLVLEAKIGLRGGATRGTRRVLDSKGCNIASGAESLWAGSSNDDHGGELGLVPFLCIKGVSYEGPEKAV